MNEPQIKQLEAMELEREEKTVLDELLSIGYKMKSYSQLPSSSTSSLPPLRKEGSSHLLAEQMAQRLFTTKARTISSKQKWDISDWMRASVTANCQDYNLCTTRASQWRL
jgi:hypothetical protein